VTFSYICNILEDGKVTYAWVSEDPGKEPPYEEIVKALEWAGR